jgi:hypothetical protein
MPTVSRLGKLAQRLVFANGRGVPWPLFDALVFLGAQRQSREWPERNDTVFDLVALR